MISEPGSFYDEVLGLGTGPLRTALTGNVSFLHPMSPGEHVIEAEVTLPICGGTFSGTYNVQVG